MRMAALYINKYIDIYAWLYVRQKATTNCTNNVYNTNRTDNTNHVLHNINDQLSHGIILSIVIQI